MKDLFLSRKADTEIVGSILMLTPSHFRQKFCPICHFFFYILLVTKYVFLKLLLGLFSLGSSSLLVLNQF